MTTFSTRAEANITARCHCACHAEEMTNTKAIELLAEGLIDLRTDDPELGRALDHVRRAIAD